MDTGQLIVDAPANGVYNMSVDQVLLNETARTGIAHLRFYQWHPATLSLGYFQRTVDREEHEPSSRIPFVRRTTGGGAIVHDCELTYSLCLPWGPQKQRHNRVLYEYVHEAIIAVLRGYGIESAMYIDPAPELPATSTGKPSFLCFQRRSHGDIICSGQKIVGSAQRREKTALLQHGSILLTHSDYAPELLGASDLTGVNPNRWELANLLEKSLSRQLKISFEPANLSEDLLRQAEEVSKGTFSTNAWTYNR